jgi:diguanylate cyclase (GGDEF)-like protein
MKEAVSVADGIRAAVEETSRSWLFPVTVSVGVVEYPIHGRSVDELVNHAEQALKAAKDAGKNRTVLAE